MKYILSIDQGTTGTTACLINASDFTFLGKHNEEYPQIYPEPSWVEHNLNDIWRSVELSITNVLKKFNISSGQIISIGITNQRETTCAFNKNGDPLSNAIVWQDRRTTSFCQNLKLSDDAFYISNKTGLQLDPYFSASKMNWLLNNNSNVKQAFDRNDLCFGTIDTFLLYKLTNQLSFKTDASNASRTMLMDLATCQWDKKLIDIFELKRELLPEICDSFGIFGYTKNLSFLPDGIPISGILGDQQAALFGQAGFNKGDMKCTYGTGAFVLFNTGTDLIYSKSGLLTTVEYRFKGQTFYALEGSSYIAGAAVQWLRDNLKIIRKSSEVEYLAREVKTLSEMDTVTFFPYFSGIGSPFWKPNARAAILGMTRDTNNNHLAHVCLEGIALSINDLLDAIKKDTGLEVQNLRVDGGAVENNLLMELQATFSKVNIDRPKVIETTAYGAALASGIGINLVQIDQLSSLWKKDKTFSPSENLKSYCERKKVLWSELVNKLFL